MDIRNFTRNIINSEIEEFNNSPKDYIEAMGWYENDWPDIEDVELDFNVSDVDQLEYVINLNIEDGTIESLDPEVIFESSPVSDFRVNMVAEKIHAVYGKV